MAEDARKASLAILIIGSCVGFWLLALAANSPGESQSQAPSAAIRSGQSTTLLPDGNWLLLGGRTDGRGVTGNAVLVDRASQKREVLQATLATSRADHTATVLPDGTVLIIGGVDRLGQPIADVERYRPDTKRFENLGDIGIAARSGHSATLLSDGQVLIVGGTDVSTLVHNDAELLDVSAWRAQPVSAQMNDARVYVEADLLPTGAVLIAGGRDQEGKPLLTSEVYDPTSRKFRNVAFDTLGVTDERDAPAVAAIFPVRASTGVSVDARFTARFSRPLRPESLTGETVTLIGPSGPADIAVTAAERGLLMFATPKQQLLPGSRYTLFIKGARDAKDQALPFTATDFQTATMAATAGRLPVLPNIPQRDATPDDSDGELWLPGKRNLAGNWRSGLAHRATTRLPKRDSVAKVLYGKSTRNGPPEAPRGVTAVAGQVLKLNSQPLRNVTLSIGTRKVLTDNNGEFLLANIPAGAQTLVIDGRTAEVGRRQYGRYEYRAVIEAGKTNVLPFVIWMTRLDARNEVNISSPTVTETIVTNPRIPALELRIPARTVIRDSDGRLVLQLSMTAIPVDQPPFPLPNSYVPVYFTIQPGGARLQGLTVEAAKGARLIYPNFSNEQPGTRFDFWNYDAREKGWYVYGQGTVSADRKQIVPDPGVAIYELSGAMVALPNQAPDEGPPPGCESGGVNGSAEAGDPVDCYTGLFLHRRTDLIVNDVLPLEVLRTYRPRDTASRSFGIGTTLSYDMFLVGDTGPYTYQDLILPDGGRVHYVRTSPGTTWSDAVYKSTSSPGKYFGSTIHWVQIGNGIWELELKDGTVYTFPEAAQASARCAALRGIRDRYGNAITFTRSSLTCNVTSVASPNGRKLTFTYDGSNRIAQASDSGGRTVTYAYDGSGRLSSVTDPANKSETYTYDSSHRMLTVTDKRNNVMVTNTYDTNGRVATQTYADSTSSSFAYALNGSNKVTQTDYTDERGTVKRVQFNAAGLPTSITDALGKTEQQTTTITRDSATNLAQTVTDAIGRVTAYQYDSNANLTQITRLHGTPDAKTWTFTYQTAFNLRTSVTDPANHTTVYGYDSAGNLTTITDPLGHVVTMSYNAQGLPISTTRTLNGSSLTTTASYIGADLSSVTDPLNRTTQYFTDALGRVTTVKDPLGNLKHVTYDTQDRVTQATDPLGHTVEYTYDENVNLLTFEDSRGNVTTFTYDTRNRLSSKTDPLTHVESYGYDAIGNLTRVTDRNGQVTGYGYDFLDRITSAGFGATTGSPSSFTSTIDYTWDAGNRLTDAVDSISGTISRDFDGLDRLTREQTPQGSIDYTYYANGLKQTMTVQGQSAVTYSYDNADRLTQIVQGSTSVGFTYDAVDRRATLTLPNGIVVTYGYDAASQLTSLTYQKASTTLGNLTYSYDAAGRRTSMGGTFAQVNLPAAVTSAVHDAANRVTTWGSHTLAYDDNGALASDADSTTQTYVWDERQRLKEIKQGTATVSSFQYDAFNRRIGKTISGVSTNFLNDDWQVVQELNGTTPTANLTGLHVDEIFRRTAGSTVEDFLTDALGSTIALTDSAGVVQTTYSYEPYGATTPSGNASSNAYQYTGRENDGGLHYYRNRYYNPALQRFVGEDPLGLSGGNNLYAYVDGDPINGVDPWGLWSIKASAYAGRGGSVSVGYNHGQFFVRMGMGVGYGGGVKIYPEGSFPSSPTDGCGCGSRAFIGGSASVGASFGPASVEYKGQAGGLVTQDCDGKPKMEFIEDRKFDWSLRGRTGWGLSLGGGINIIDLGVAK